MEQHSTFQWSIYTVDRSQQFVVRCDDFEQFVVAIQQVLSIMPGLELPITLERLSAEQKAKPQATSPAPPPAQAKSDAAQTEKPAPSQTKPAHYCPIHTDKQMKLRTGKDGQTWYDHRWKDEAGQWHACNGERERVGGGASQ